MYLARGLYGGIQGLSKASGLRTRFEWFSNLWVLLEGGGFPQQGMTRVVWCLCLGSTLSRIYHIQ